MGESVIGPFNDELFVLRIITMKFYDLEGGGGRKCINQSMKISSPVKLKFQGFAGFLKQKLLHVLFRIFSS